MKYPRSGAQDHATLGGGALMTVVGRGVAGATQLATQAVLARILGPAGLGLWAIAWAGAKLLGGATAVGLSESVVRFGTTGGTEARPEPGPAIRFCVLGAVIVGAMVGLAVLLGSPWIAGDLFKKPELTALFQIMAPVLVAIPVLEVASSGTRLNARMGFSVLGRDLTPALSHLILVSVVAASGLGLLAATGATTVSFVAGTLVSLYLLSRRFPGYWRLRPTRQEARSVVRFASSVSIIGVLGLLATRVDLILVGLLLAANQAGLYNSAVQISVAFLLVLGGLNSVFGPVCAGLLRRGEQERLSRLFSVSTKWGLYVSFPLALPVLLLPAQTITIVFGDAYAPASTALVLLVAAQLVNVGSGPVGLLLLMSGNEAAWSRASALAASVGVGVSLLLIPSLGITGAGLGTLLSTTVLFGSGLLLVRSRLALWPYDSRYLKGLAAGVLAAVSLIALRAAMEIDGGPEWMLGFFVSSSVFVTTLYFLGLDSEDREFVGWIRTRLARTDALESE